MECPRASVSRRERLRWGSAAASVVAEHVGVPAVPAGDSGVRGEVRRRFEALLRRTVKIVEHEQENAHG